MRHPFQCLQACCIPGSPWRWVLLAAAGSRINLFALSDGTLLSTLDIGTLIAAHDGSQLAQPTERDEGEEPPEKRQKTSDDSISDQRAATILTLTATRDCRDVVVVTGEDKCIRVFRFQDDGHLHLLSAR
jgi:tRNA (guanine-N(7)-)-methyltransferase subunit TRM82